MKYISMLYKSSVLPILEYAAPVWSPYLEKDIHLLECVQNLFILSRMLQDNVKQKYNVLGIFFQFFPAELVFW